VDNRESQGQDADNGIQLLLWEDTFQLIQTIDNGGRPCFSIPLVIVILVLYLLVFAGNRFFCCLFVVQVEFFFIEFFLYFD
jgi:hypothetical protein